MGDWLVELPPANRLVLYGGVSVRTAAADIWRVPFAEEPCRSRRAGSRATLWMGPDEHLLLDLAPAETPAASIERLGQALGERAHALVDISQRQIALEVRGPQAALILNGGCPLDLDAARFPVGMCTRTLFAKADIVLWRVAEDAFHVEVWRSFRDYLVAALREVATSDAMSIT